MPEVDPKSPEGGPKPETESGVSSGRGIPGMQTFAALQHRDYRYLWMIISCGNTATYIQQVTLALLILDQTGSSFWVGTVLGIRALPVVLIGPLAGVALDRLDRKMLLMGSQLVLAALVISFAVGVQADVVDKYWALLFSFLMGVDLSINQPARQSLIANVVPRETLPNAIALENSFGTIIRTVAPIAGIALITPLGFAGNFFVQGAVYLLIFVVAIPMKTPYRTGVATGTSVRGNLVEGFRYIKGDTILLLLIVLIIIPSVFVHATQNLFVVFAQDAFGGDEKFTLGLMYLAMGTGALVAIFGVASLGNLQRKGIINLSSIMLVSLMLVFFGLSSHLAMALIFLGLVGMFNMAFRIANNSLVQTRIPDALRGRITSIYVIDHGVQPIGSPLLALLAEERVLGPGKAVMVAGLLALVVSAFISLRWRQLWKLS